MVTVGDRVQYSVVVLDDNGRVIEPLPSWAQPIWETADTATLDISPDGAANALDYAETDVMASFAGLRARTPLRVNPTRLTLTAPTYYITQGVQNTRRGLPLIAGRDALLRVFVTGDRRSYYQPRVEALFYHSDALIHGVAIAPEFRLLPVDVDESRLQLSYNARIPSSVIVPGTDLVIRLDKDGVVPATPESQLRIPSTGRMRLDVRTMPRFDLTVVPIKVATDPKGLIHRWVNELTPTSEQLAGVRTLLPVSDLTVRRHEGFVTTADLSIGRGWGELLGELVFLRIREGERGYYYGAMMLGEDAIWDGLGQIGYPASIGKADPGTLAHELGHNMGLRHAPCGGATSADTSYPYDGGAIGVWGYDFEREHVVSATLYKDLMGYCYPRWISDYHFARAMDFRLVREALVMGSARANAPAGASAPTEAGARAGASAPGADGWLMGPVTRSGGINTHVGGKTLLLWGRAVGGELVLDPAFMVDAPVTLPTSDGPYRLEGLGPAGERRFSLSFAMRPLEYGGGNFVFTVPFDPDRDGALDRVELWGPEGSHALERFGSRPMAMVTEGGSGKLRAVLRDWDGRLPASLALDVRDTEIAVSEGLPF